MGGTDHHSLYRYKHFTAETLYHSKVLNCWSDLVSWLWSTGDHFTVNHSEEKEPLLQDFLKALMWSGALLYGNAKFPFQSVLTFLHQFSGLQWSYFVKSLIQFRIEMSSVATSWFWFNHEGFCKARSCFIFITEPYKSERASVTRTKCTKWDLCGNCQANRVCDWCWWRW